MADVTLPDSVYRAAREAATRFYDDIRHDAVGDFVVDAVHAAIGATYLRWAADRVAVGIRLRELADSIDPTHKGETS